MPIFTAPDAIPSPSIDDPFQWAPQLEALAEGTQVALNKRGNAYKGTVAQRNAFTNAPEGTLWSDTNSNRQVWRRINGSWEQFIDDTGWVNIPLAEGFAVYENKTPQARIRDEVLYLRGCIRASSGNMPVSGQVDVTGPIQMIADRAPHPNSAWDVAPCFGPTGGTLFRLYITADHTLRYGGSDKYGNGTASYMSLSGASGCWTFG